MSNLVANLQFRSVTTMGDSENKDEVNQRLLEKLEKLVDSNTSILKRMSQLENNIEKLEKQHQLSKLSQPETTVPKTPSKNEKRRQARTQERVYQLFEG